MAYDSLIFPNTAFVRFEYIMKMQCECFLYEKMFSAFSKKANLLIFSHENVIIE